MYGRIPYLNNSLSSWAIHHSDLRCLLYYTGVCSGAPPSAPLHFLYYLYNYYMVCALVAMDTDIRTIITILPDIVKTLNLTVEYTFQLEAYI